MFLSRHTAKILVVICAAVWIACAMNPYDLEAWMLEQLALLLALLVLVWCVRRQVRFSTADKVAIATLFIAHSLGTHFTYSLTPYDQFFQDLCGFSLNELGGWSRNQYDRFVHLLYGVCMAMPVARVLVQTLDVGFFASRFLAFHLVISTSALYELLEWAAASLFGGDLGELYLGTQGDAWDAQADIALAGVGQLAVYAVHAAFNMHRKGTVR